MVFLIVFSILAGLILFVMIRGTCEERKQKQAYRAYLEQKYGAYRRTAYSQEDMNRIAKRYAYKKKDINQAHYFILDEITWNDLEMDKVFDRLNVTQSAAGAEYLYSMLHMPCLEKDRLDALERHITYFDTHEQVRVHIQECCHVLGDTGKYSIYDYILYLTGANPVGAKKHAVLCFLFFASLLLLLFYPTIGVICFLVSACGNVLSYMNTKRQILPYLTGISYIRRLLQTADKVGVNDKSDMPGEIKELFLAIRKDTEALSGFRKHACFVSGMRTNSGSPVQLVMDYLRMFTHLDLIQYHLMMQELIRHEQEIIRILDAIGYVDAVIAIASYRKGCNVWSVPVLQYDNGGLTIKEGVHPLLKTPVANDYAGNRGMLVTGSNASGKSTFLKMVALNAVLAQTIHTVTAVGYEGQFFRIYSSMTLRDSLDGGDSYYMVEIKALKRIMDASVTDGPPVLCFVDEVLRGTNTVERIAASSQILKYLAGQNAYCFAATHDVELTYLLEQEYDNFHFREDMEGKDIVFSYRLLPGRADTRNAIKLLQQLGFEERVVEQAEALAGRFLETNQWI